jgi:aminoacrylate hydrolase
MGAEMPIADIGDAEIYYEAHGDGPPLMLVAGLGGLGSFWRDQIPAFREHFTVIVHDHRGTGKSTPSKITYSVELLASDALKLMDCLGIEKAHYVGHSTGAAMGQVIAIESPHRVSTMVQYASWTTADAHLRLCFDIRQQLLINCGLKAYVHSTPHFLMPPSWVRDHEEQLQAEEAQALQGMSDPDIMLRRISAILAFDRTTELHKIDVPTLILCARDDILTPLYFSEALAKAIPGARLIVHETGGHALSQTEPNRFNAAILDFLLPYAGEGFAHRATA